MKHSLLILTASAALCGGCGALERGDAPGEDVTDVAADAPLGDGATAPGDGEADAPPVTLSFADDGVHDALMTDCASSGCHGGAGGGDFVLSGDASADYSVTLNVVTPGDASGSRLLRKAINEISHAGGPTLVPEDDAYQLIAAWIDGGANP